MRKNRSRGNTPELSALHKKPAAGYRLKTKGVTTIEAVLSPSGAPVLGLYLHTVHLVLLRSLSRDPRFRSIKPHLLGTPAILARFPGLSQVELAGMLGTERATAGLHVAHCVKNGLVRRVVSSQDKRRYELFVTSKGRRILEAAVRAIPAHEEEFATSLSEEERETLRRLLMKLISSD